jgi:hypothetical protein
LGKNDVAALYVDHPVLLPQGSGFAISSVTLASSASGAIRPMAANQLAHESAFEVGASAGLGRNLLLQMRGMSDRLTLEGVGKSAGVLGLGWFLPLPRNRLILVSAGYLQEFTGVQGAWVRISGEARFERLTVAANAHTERAFAARRDSADLLVTAGCYYDFDSAVRAGVEYVGQDLEGWFEPAEREGVRETVGPVLKVQDSSKKLAAAVGPSWGVAGSAGLLVTRVSIAFTF